jgi:hypothetical protein
MILIKTQSALKQITSATEQLESDKISESENDTAASTASEKHRSTSSQPKSNNNNNNNNNNERINGRAKFYQWARRFRRSDPRFRILEFFHNVEQDGCREMCEMDEEHRHCLEGCFQSHVTTTTNDNDNETKPRPSYAAVPSNCFNRAGVFSVWRPCSFEAIKKMMTGQGVGKGLDIKGKSAQKGNLSGFVPFLQIHEDKHKRRIKTLQRDSSLRLFFKTQQARTNALQILEPLAEEMRTGFLDAKSIIENEDNSLRAAHRASTLIGGVDFTWVGDEGIDREEALNRHMWDIGDANIDLIDDYAPKFYGIDLPQRLFWEAYVIRQNISREPEYETGRPSCPEFQDCNIKSLGKQKNKSDTRPVILQYKEDPNYAMCVQNLLMAYEMKDQRRVMPVISDFDCFLLGTRRVSFHKELPAEQKELLKWQVSKIESILDGPDRDETWTMQWLEMLKSEMHETGFHAPEVPKFGFGDPISYYIMGHAVARLEEDGSVRHGAECFNYTFPQDLDDKFFVISSQTRKLALELDREELVTFLSRKADEGYMFPLNPKWVLCDLGFKSIYDKLMANKETKAQIAMNTWFPPETGVREMIEAIHKKHPDCFQRTSRMYLMKKRRYSPLRQCLQAGYDIDGTTAMELARMELQHYSKLQSCKVVAHAIIAAIRMYAKMQVYNKREARGSIVQYDVKSDD